MESLRANETGSSGESAEAGYGDGDAECERVQADTWGVVEEDCEPEWGMGAASELQTGPPWRKLCAQTGNQVKARSTAHKRRSINAPSLQRSQTSADDLPPPSSLVANRTGGACETAMSCSAATTQTPGPRTCLNRAPTVKGGALRGPIWLAYTLSGPARRRKDRCGWCPRSPQSS